VYGLEQLQKQSCEILCCACWIAHIIAFIILSLNFESERTAFLDRFEKITEKDYICGYSIATFVNHYEDLKVFLSLLIALY
jgi:hypothetical protein